MTADISFETIDARVNGMTFFKCWKKNTPNTKFYIQKSDLSRNTEEIVICSEKLRECVANEPILNEWEMEASLHKKEKITEHNLEFQKEKENVKICKKKKK